MFLFKWACHYCVGNIELAAQHSVHVGILATAERTYAFEDMVSSVCIPLVKSHLFCLSMTFITALYIKVSSMKLEYLDNTIFCSKTM